MKILAAIITFNRCNLLARCLNFVEAQTRLVNEILVINNGSSDGTLSMLVARNINVISQENQGSAGGWHTAIRYALDHDFDAVWLMDDDGYPDVHSLMRLEHFLIPGFSCVSAVVVCEDCPDRLVFPLPLLSNNGLPKIFSVPRKIKLINKLWSRSPTGVYPFVHLFNGALISCETLRRVGNVDKKFFIFGEEVDFFFRLRAVGRTISVLSAKHYHPDVSQRPYTPLKIYYYIKNTLVLNSRYFDAVFLRNCLAVIVVLIRIAQRNGKREALRYLIGSRSRYLFQAIVRGLQGRIGKDFDG